VWLPLLFTPWVNALREVLCVEIVLVNFEDLVISDYIWFEDTVLVG
jgi:hypothetical protein